MANALQKRVEVLKFAMAANLEFVPETFVLYEWLLDTRPALLHTLMGCSFARGLDEKENEQRCRAAPGCEWNRAFRSCELNEAHRAQLHDQAEVARSLQRRGMLSALRQRE